MEKKVIPQEHASPVYQNAYSYLMEKVELSKKINQLSIAQLAGLFGFSSNDYYLQGVNLNKNNVIVKKFQAKSPCQKEKINDMTVQLQDRKTHNLVLEKWDNILYFHFFYFGRIAYNGGQQKAIYKIYQKRRCTMRNNQKNFTTQFEKINTFLNQQGTDAGFCKSKNYQFTGRLVNSWEEQGGLGYSTSFSLYEKKDGSFLLFTQNHNRWQGQGATGSIQEFSSLSELAEYDENMACMAGYVIQL